MKRIIALFLSLMLLLTSCGGVFDDFIKDDVIVDSSNPTDEEKLPADPEESSPEEGGPDTTDPEESSPEESGPDTTDPEDEESSSDGDETDEELPENGSEEQDPEEDIPSVDGPVQDGTGEEGSDNTVPMHKYVSEVTAPSCERNGYTTYTCSECGDYYVANIVSSTGHSYKSTVTAPDCDNDGYTAYTCSVCGDTYVSDVTDHLEHAYTASVTAPTCESSGYTTYTCSLCADSYVSNRVDSFGHKYNSVVTSPTCDSEGYTTYTCTVCYVSYVSNRVSALGHNYKSTVVPPTCTIGGYTTYKCSVCYASYVSDRVGALGHDWLAATTSAPKTCKTCGATEGDKLPSSSSGKTLYVNYIDVGQGDCIFIKVGDCDILIDAGTSAYGSTVSNYLKSMGVDDIELMINTHPDNDHYGGLPRVLNDFEVEDIWVSSFAKSNSEYNNFKSAVSKEGLSMKNPAVGTIFTYEYMTITVLYSGAGATTSNDASIVVMLQYGSARFLFTGDISSTIESMLVDNSNIDLSCDVLKVGHHGSKYSSDSTFLKATGAKYGVICVGSDNSYGHPTSQALNRLASAGISVYRTDKHGNIVFSTDGTSLKLPGSSGTVSAGSYSTSSSSSTDTFIGNKESKIFHLPTCSNLPGESKRNYLYNYWFIINCIGYTPCQICMKNYEP